MVIRQKARERTGVPVESIQPAAIQRSRPQRAGPIFEEGKDIIVTQTTRIIRVVQIPGDPPCGPVDPVESYIAAVNPEPAFLIFQDIAVVILVLLIPMLGEGGGTIGDIVWASVRA